MSGTGIGRQEIAASLAAFISEEILGDDSAIDFEQNLLNEDIVNSLGMLRLVGFIEMSYDLVIPPEHFVIENFRSLNTISEYVVRRLAAGAGD